MTILYIMAAITVGGVLALHGVDFLVNLIITTAAVMALAASTHD